jgi:gluconolactonase
MTTMRSPTQKWLVVSVVLVAVQACGGPETPPWDLGGPGAGEDEGGLGDSTSPDSGSGDSENDGASSSSSSDGASGAAGDGQDDSHGPGPFEPLDFSKIGQAVLISDQFYFTEGPVWDPTNDALYFTDINARQSGKAGGAILRLKLPDTIDVLLQPDGNADGLGLDPQGDIIAAGFASRSIWRFSNAAMQTLASCPSAGTATCYLGQEVNTPDDITVRSDGIIYFTDPTFASGGQGFPSQSLALASAQGVYRLTVDGTLSLEDASTSGPNGVNLSPDEKTLYVAYTLANSVAQFDVAPDGSLSGKRTFVTAAALADSMCVDAGGNVYVGTSSGLAVFSPEGQALGTISVGGQVTTNCAFGGPDQRTLFITSRARATLVAAPVANDSSLYKIDNMPVPGIPGRN